jgi:hypothetical protein
VSDQGEGAKHFVRVFPDEMFVKLFDGAEIVVEALMEM